MQRLAEQTILKAGRVPDRLPEPLFAGPTYAVARDAFLLRLPNGLAYHYVRGKGVTVERPRNITEAEVQLFFDGSVYGAVAWLNGLVPLHASAVVHDGRVFAFTGHSGAGKSTLVAGLTRRGYPLQADDVLVLDPAGEGAIIALPGHKQIKLWKDALALTAAEAGPRVRPALEKYYAVPHAGSHPGPLPLARLYFLKAAARETPSIAPVTGMKAYDYLPSALYRRRFYKPLATPERHFALMTRLARSVSFFTFDRPFLKASFEAGIDAIEADIRRHD